MTSFRKTNLVIAFLFTSSLIGTPFLSSKAQAGNSFFGGFVVGAITGAVISHAVHNDWHKGRRSYKRTAKAKQQSALPKQSFGEGIQNMENTTTIAKSAAATPEGNNFRPALEPSLASTSINKQ